MTDLPRVYTVAEAAEYIRCSDSKVRRLIRAKILRATQVGNQWRITEGALRDLLTPTNVDKPKKTRRRSSEMIKLREHHFRR